MKSSAVKQISNGRSATYLEPNWERVAPCQWRAQHHLGLKDVPLVLTVKLEERAYLWEVAQGRQGMAGGVCRTPSQARAAARRAASDVTSTMRPALRRQKTPKGKTRTTNNARSLDYELLPFVAFALLLANVGLNYYAVAVGTAETGDLMFSVFLAATGATAFLAWRQYRSS